MEKVKLLWDEYKYRHDLIWKNIYKITAASVALSLVPYAGKVTDAFARFLVENGLLRLLLVPPALAVGVVAYALFVMANELHLFQQIKDEYRDLRYRDLELKRVYELDLKHMIKQITMTLLPFLKKEQSEHSSQISERSSLRFHRFVYLYLIVLLVLVASNFVFATRSLSGLYSNFLP